MGSSSVGGTSSSRTLRSGTRVPTSASAAATRSGRAARTCATPSRRARASSTSREVRLTCTRLGDVRPYGVRPLLLRGRLGLLRIAPQAQRGSYFFQDLQRALRKLERGACRGRDV